MTRAHPESGMRPLPLPPFMLPRSLPAHRSSRPTETRGSPLEAPVGVNPHKRWTIMAWSNRRGQPRACTPRRARRREESVLSPAEWLQHVGDQAQLLVFGARRTETAGARSFGFGSPLPSPPSVDGSSTPGQDAEPATGVTAMPVCPFSLYSRPLPVKESSTSTTIPSSTTSTTWRARSTSTCRLAPSYRG